MVVVKDSIIIRKAGMWLLAFISTVAISYTFSLSTASFFNLVILAFLGYAYQRIGFPQNIHLRAVSSIGAILTAGVFVLGRISYSNESIRNVLSRYKESVIKDENSIILFSGWGNLADKCTAFVMFIGLVIFLFFLACNILKRLKSRDIGFEVKLTGMKSGQVFILSWLGIVAFWTPYFLLNFPGILSYDSVNQISQIKGVVPWSNWHPVVHTLFIKFCLSLADMFKMDMNSGVALYSLIQMIILSGIYGYLISTLYKCGLKKIYCLFIFLYFAVIPFNALFAIAMYKDVLFAGAVLWFSIVMMRIFICKEYCLKNYCLLFFSGTLMAMFRSNGLIAYFFSILFIILFLRHVLLKKKFLIIIFLLPVAINLIVTGPVYERLGIQKANFIESLCMPIQQISRVVLESEESLTEDEISEIERFIAPLDEIKMTYNCRFADPMKQLIWGHDGDKKIQENVKEFLVLWIKLGFEHPIEYIKSECDATMGYWFPDGQYPTIFTGVYPNDFGITQKYFFGETTWQRFVQYLEIYRYVPVLGNLYSMGSMFLLMLWIIIGHLYLKQVNRILISVPTVMVWLSIMLAAPLHSEMRYMYCIMLTVPLMAGAFCLGVKRV